MPTINHTGSVTPQMDRALTKALDDGKVTRAEAGKIANAAGNDVGNAQDPEVAAGKANADAAVMSKLGHVEFQRGAREALVDRTQFETAARDGHALPRMDKAVRQATADGKVNFKESVQIAIAARKDVNRSQDPQAVASLATRLAETVMQDKKVRVTGGDLDVLVSEALGHQPSNALGNMDEALRALSADGVITRQDAAKIAKAVSMDVKGSQDPEAVAKLANRQAETLAQMSDLKFMPGAREALVNLTAKAGQGKAPVVLERMDQALKAATANGEITLAEAKKIAKAASMDVILSDRPEKAAKIAKQEAQQLADAMDMHFGPGVRQAFLDEMASAVVPGCPL